MVVPFLEITLWENYTLLTFVTISVLLIIYIRYQSKQSFNIDEKPASFILFNQWLDTNVSLNHLNLYLISLVSIICALILGMYLSLTTICHTYLQFDFLLIPDDCSEIYFDIK